MNEQKQGHACHVCNYLSWSAVFAGALILIGLSFLFNLFNVAVGLSLVSTTSEGTTMAVGGLIAILITTIIATFAGGYTAGSLGRFPDSHACCVGMLYGFLAWCVALILSAILAGSMAYYIASFSSLLSQTSNSPMVAVMGDRLTNIRKDDTKEMGSAYRERKESTLGSDGFARIQPESAARGMTYGSMVLFIIFLIGALSSTIGGYFSVRYSDKMYPTK